MSKDLIQLELIKNAGVELDHVIQQSQIMNTEQNTTVSKVLGDVQILSKTAAQIIQDVYKIGQDVNQSFSVSHECSLKISDTSVKMLSFKNEFETITKLLRTIETLANQTNLLALNATIEAARAGDAGKSFAVVASEVKELSRTTQKANSEITTSIETLAQSVTVLSKAMDETQKMISDLEKSTQLLQINADTVGSNASILQNTIQTTTNSLSSMENSLSASDRQIKEIDVIGVTFDSLLKLISYEGGFNSFNDPLKKFEPLAEASPFKDSSRFSSRKGEVLLGEKDVLISITDSRGVISFANDTFCRIAGYKVEELVNRPHNIVRHPDMPKSAFKDLWDVLKTKTVWQGFVKNKTKSGGFYWVKATAFPILNSRGDIEGYISVRAKPSSRDVARAEAIYQKLP